MAFEEALESMCDGRLTDIELAKRKTGEEYHMWLERRVKAAKKMRAEMAKEKAK